MAGPRFDPTPSLFSTFKDVAGNPRLDDKSISVVSQVDAKNVTPAQQPSPRLFQPVSNNVPITKDYLDEVKKQYAESVNHEYLNEMKKQFEANLAEINFSYTGTASAAQQLYLIGIAANNLQKILFDLKGTTYPLVEELIKFGSCCRQAHSYNPRDFFNELNVLLSYCNQAEVSGRDQFVNRFQSYKHQIQRLSLLFIKQKALSLNDNDEKRLPSFMSKR